MADVIPRQQLIDLADQIRDAKDRGQDLSELVEQLQSRVAYPNVGELFNSDHPAAVIADYLLGWRDRWPTLTHAEMVQVVGRIVNVEGTEGELKVMIELFDSNCQHPAKNGLIFYPEEYFDGDPDPSVERIVEKAMTPLSSR